jgi:hypothetical protein
VVGAEALRVPVTAAADAAADAAVTAAAPAARSSVVGWGCTPVNKRAGMPASATPSVTVAITGGRGERVVGHHDHLAGAGGADHLGQLIDSVDAEVRNRLRLNHEPVNGGHKGSRGRGLKDCGSFHPA